LHTTPLAEFPVIHGAPSHDSARTMEEGAGGCLLDYLCTLYISFLDFLRTMKVRNRVGLRVAPPKPGEDRTEDGDADGGTQGEERRSEDGDVGRGEGEELEDEKGAEDEEEWVAGAKKSFPWVAMQAACRYFFILSFFSLRCFGDRPGGGRGELPRAAGGL